MAILKLLHILSIVVWVGGMFFAYVVLRPSAVEILQPPERLKLWDRVFSRFFRWVWLSVILVLASGMYMAMLFGGLALAPRYIHVMLLLGVVMALIFFYVFFSCYRHLGRRVAAQEWPQAGEMLAKIRKLVAVNLGIGLLTVAVAILGGMA
jgi:uncharacterized membrane protein